MGSWQAFFDGVPHSRKALTLPPGLDMGTVKADDFDFDVAREAARLRWQHERQPQPRQP